MWTYVDLCASVIFYDHLCASMIFYVYHSDSDIFLNFGAWFGNGASYEMTVPEPKGCKL